MQIIKRQTLVFKLILNLRLDRKRRVHECGLKAKNETSLWTHLIKEWSVGEVQRHPSCSMTCCLKCSCLQRSLCNCSLQCCGYTAAQQIVSKQSSLQYISNYTLSICLQRRNQGRLQNEQIAVHLHFYHMNHMEHIYFCLYAT